MKTTDEQARDLAVLREQALAQASRYAAATAERFPYAAIRAERTRRVPAPRP